MVNIIHKYVHEYNFPYHDYLKFYKEELVEFFYNPLNHKSKTSNDHTIYNHPINDFLLPKLNKIVKKNYFLSKPTLNKPFNIYVQDNKTTKFFFHNHINTAGTIVGVFYIDPPQEGGELMFLINPPPINLPTPTPPLEQQILTIRPQKNKLYLFPSWLYHSPTPQKSPIPRICFNWNYLSNLRPTHKLTSVKW